MAYSEKTVATTTTECEFIKEFIRQLTELDSRITCNTDIDAQYADTSNTPQFNVHIAGYDYDIAFRRYDSLSSSYWNSGTGPYYTVTYNVNNIDVSFKLLFAVADSGMFSSSIIQRTIKFKIISNDNVINMLFGNYDTDIGNATISQYANIIYLLGDTNYISYATTTDPSTIMDNVFYNLDASDTQNYKLINQFNFTMSNQQTKIEKSKPLLLNVNNTFIGNINGLYDCSTVPAGQILTIGDINYYSINSHTLMPI